MRDALRHARLPVGLTVVAAVLALTLPGRTELVVRIYAVTLAAVLLARLVAAIRSALPPRAASEFDAALRRRPARAARLPELEKLEREVTLGMSTAFDLHYRLRPTLRRIAGELLAARRGIDLDGRPDEARRALGEETWQLVRGDREPPAERYASGIDTASLGRVVAALESL